MKHTAIVMLIIFALVFYFATKTLASETNTEILSTSLVKNNYNKNYEISKLFQNYLDLENKVIYTAVPRGLIVSIDSRVFFDDGDYNIKTEALNLLCKIGYIICEINKPCTIEAHNTKIKISQIYKYGWELSQIRADTLVDYLINEANVSAPIIRATGFGEIMPFNDNVSFKGNMNDRIDIVIHNYALKFKQ